jgi:hypothetical protein
MERQHDLPDVHFKLAQGARPALMKGLLDQLIDRAHNGERA